MRRFLSPFLLIFTTLILLCYGYAAHQLCSHWAFGIPLAIPFLSVWLIPVLYWAGDKNDSNPRSHYLQTFSYLSMGWLNFVFVLLIPLNLAYFIARAFGKAAAALTIDEWTAPVTLIGSVLALALGFWRARRGPSLREVKIELDLVTKDLEGLRIVQISDLHIGPTIHKPYVEKVVEQSNLQSPDLIVLTGDIVDGSVLELLAHAQPLSRLRARYGVYFILGNHDYYSGADVWVKEFQAMGIKVLLNSHVRIRIGASELLLAGVLDPAVKGFSKELKPDPALALGDPKLSEGMLRILLAHNPKLAPEAARAGFNLQISGHTHAGQFIPWTWVTKWIHDPHYAGLSKENEMTVYVSAGTGSWGPPLRLGTSPELTTLILQAKIRST